VVFTKSVVVADLTKIYFYLGSSKIYLSTDDVILNNNKAGNRILEIQLDDDTAVRIVSATTSNLAVNFDNGAFTETLSIPTEMMSSNNAIYSALSGMVCFVGDFTYIDNISHPVFVKETSEENWIIGNSSIFYIDIDSNKEDSRTVPDIIEINPTDITDIDDKLISSDVKFSDYSLGGVYEHDGRFIISCISDVVTSLSSVVGDDLRAEYNPVPDNIEFRASAIDDLKNYAGTVVILDKVNSRKTVLYSSPDGLYPSDIDSCSNGDLIISESSFADASGRLIKIDAYGNIVWNYGQGSFAVINDVKALNDDKLIISV